MKILIHPKLQIVHKGTQAFGCTYLTCKKNFIDSFEVFEASRFWWNGLSMEGQKYLRFCQKHFHLCFKVVDLEQHEGN